MKRTLRILLLVAALAGCVTLRAQDIEDDPRLGRPTAPYDLRQSDDFQARMRAILEVPIARNLDFEWSEQVRLHNNFSDLDKIVSSVGLNYKPLRWLKVGASYSLVNARDEDSEIIDTKPVSSVEWKWRHMVNIDITGSYKVGRVKLSLRERVRLNFRADSVNRYEHANPAISLRSRLKAAYDIRQCRWEPYAYVELYNTINARDAVPNFLTHNIAFKQYISRWRFAVGAEFKINNHQRLDIYYRFQMNQSYDVRYKNNKGDLKPNYDIHIADPSKFWEMEIVPRHPSDMGWRRERQNCHIIGIDYKFKL